MDPREELLENIAHLVSENRRLTADRDLYRDLWLKAAEMPFMAASDGAPGGAEDSTEDKGGQNP